MTSRTVASPGSLWSVLASAGHAAVLLRGAAGSLLVKVTASGLLFVSQIVFARYLGVESFGLYVLALAWLSVLVLLGRVGFDIATVRYVASYAGSGEWGLLRGFMAAGTATVVIASVVVGALFAAGVSLFVPKNADALRNVLLLAALATLPLSLIQMQAAALRGLGHIVMGDVPFSVVHPTLLLALFLAALLWAGIPASAELALCAYIAASLAAMGWLWPLLRTRLPLEARRTPPAWRWREWLTAAPAMILIAGFGVVLNQSSVIMTGALAGAADAGLFGAATRLAGVLQIITFSLITAIGPLIARLHAAGEGAALQKAIDTGVRAVFAVACAAALGLCIFGEEALSLFGSSFAEAEPALLILLAGQIVWAATAASGAVLNMTGHQNASAAILAASAVTNLVLCWVFIPQFGMAGAAAATALSMAGSNLAMAIRARTAAGLRSYVSIGTLRP